MTKYVSKPIEIEALQFLWGNFSEMKEFVGAYGLPGPQIYQNSNGIRELIIPIDGAYLLALEGDWVCRRDDGIAIFKDDEFHKLWEEPNSGYVTYNIEHPKSFGYTCVKCGAYKVLTISMMEPDRIGCPVCNGAFSKVGNVVWMLPSDNPMFAFKEAHQNAARRVR